MTDLFFYVVTIVVVLAFFSNPEPIEEFASDPLVAEPDQEIVVAPNGSSSVVPIEESAEFENADSAANIDVVIDTTTKRSFPTFDHGNVHDIMPVFLSKKGTPLRGAAYAAKLKQWREAA